MYGWILSVKGTVVAVASTGAVATRVAVIGAAGHTGGEMCRLLLGHEAVTSIEPASHKADPFERVHPNLLGSGLRFVSPEQVAQNAESLDFVFLCLPHGESMRVARHYLDAGARVIDLGADFRFRSAELYQRTYGIVHGAPDLLDRAVYGLTELNRDLIREARLIANPGCHVTAAVLGIAPLLAHHIVHPEAIPHICAINGTTGAGGQPRRETAHAESFAGMLPYSLDGHRHGPELEDQLSVLAGRELTVDMSTAHGNFARGIHVQASVGVSAQRRAGLSRTRLLDLYHRYYEAEPFVQINTQEARGGRVDKDYGRYPSVASVMGANFCHVGIDYDSDREIVKVVAVIDNLVKGAAGSALQNMNVMLGIPETTGLSHYGL